jgi:hypothetical protein
MRRTGSRRGAQNPHTLGGRRAHGPKVEKDWSRKLNAKQRHAARNAALAATVSMETVAARGHRFDDTVEHLPIVLGSYTEIVDGKSTEYDIETFNHGSATRKAAAIFAGLGLGPTWTGPEQVAKSVLGKPPCVDGFTRPPSPCSSWSKKNRDWPKPLVTSLVLTSSLPRTCAQRTLLPVETSVV